MKKFAVSCLALFLISSIATAVSAASDGKFAAVATGGTSIFSQEIAETIFNNTGNYTFFHKQGTSGGDVDDRAGITMWLKGSLGQEKVDFDGYKKFDANYYGAVVGIDTDRKYSDKVDATYGIFVAYTEGNLENGEKARLNGGFAGLKGNLYIGKLFFGALADFGLRKTKVSSNGDEQDFDSQSIGIALKAGYNFELKDNSFTLQPNIVFNSDFDISEGYKLDGTKVESDDYFNLNVSPGVKAAKNLGRCWILTGELRYFITSSNGKVEIDDINDYNNYYSNYALFGLGVEKIWGYTVLHLKVNKTFSGRDGIMGNAGIEFKF